MSTFEEHFRSEQDCRAFLKKLKYPEGRFYCQFCGNTTGTQLATRDLIQCNFCKRQSSLTAGTIFHGTRIPLLKAFRITWEVCAGIMRSASRLAKELDLAYSTTWQWMQRLRTVLERMIDHEEFVELDTASIQDVLFRRSLESPARSKGKEASFKSMPEHTPGPLVVSDMSEHQAPDAADETVASASCAMRAFVRKTFHGISRKYAQKYAVQLGFALLHSAKPLQSLATIMRHDPIPRWAIRMYSSPAIVSLPLRAIRKDTCIKLWRLDASR